MPIAKLCMPSKKLKFDKEYYVYDLEWPVYVIECVANKIQEKNLNILETAVLRLLAAQPMSSKSLANKLCISNEIISVILSELEEKKWINKTNGIKLTEQAVLLLKGEEEEIDDFSKERTFGYMFVSRVDDFVMPYFWEGELPIIRDLESEPNALILRYDNNKKLQYKGLDSKLHSAYVDYVRATNRALLSDKDKKEKKSEIRFVSRSVYSPDLEEAFDSQEHTGSINDKKELDSKIHALATSQKQAYLTFKLCVSKASPETFYVVSPFVGHDIPRYSRTFKQMKNDKEVKVKFNNNIISLDQWCQDITKEIYDAFPMLKRKLDSDTYLKLTYPILATLGQHRDKIKKPLLEVVNNIKLCEAKEITPNSLVMVMCRTLEFIFTCFIECTDVNSIVRVYKNAVKSENDIDLLFFKNFGIYHCSALSKEKACLKRSCHSGKYNGILSSFYMRGTGKKFGNSLVDKYFYLLVYACYSDPKMKTMINKEGLDFIDNLDDLIKKRNTYGAHCDSTTNVTMPDSDIESLIVTFDKVAKPLLSIL